MTQSNKVQIINIPNTLRAKVGGKLGSPDDKSVARAEAALEDLSVHFNEWLISEIARLEDQHKRLRAEGITPETLEALYFSVHDLKGLGSTYGFPLVTRLAGSMCKILEEEQKRLKVPQSLIDAHIHAIKSVIRDDVRTEDHPTASFLAAELEMRSKEFLDSITA